MAGRGTPSLRRAKAPNAPPVHVTLPNMVTPRNGGPPADAGRLPYRPVNVALVSVRNLVRFPTPPNHNIHLFMKGISSLSRVTGQEHASICQFLLALVIDAVPICQSSTTASTRHRLLKSLRGLLDFLYLAQYPIHTTTTLQLMEDALARFHDEKDVFVELGVRNHFNIPKLHFAVHYIHLIKLFGTTDNFNTEYTERLHIDLAKDAYAATNRKGEFPQMTVWLTRREKMSRHAEYVSWRLAGSPLLHPVVSVVPGMDLTRPDS